ncbi:hypothetical protein L195_g007124 [Trifolium pratense]|uniref:Uncharacterized protein n=1 Tax=Trifolium pratense TaxID=57577 RepID=A0A2K3P5I3_TRIPR|nr:hypothetical protein L195_g007124 [Trifolium pratense]
MLPTKDNLLRRRALVMDQAHCVPGCRESARMFHLIFDCPLALNVSIKILKCLGLSSTLSIEDTLTSSNLKGCYTQGKQGTNPSSKVNLWKSLELWRISNCRLVEFTMVLLPMIKVRVSDIMKFGLGVLCSAIPLAVSSVSDLCMFAL